MMLERGFFIALNCPSIEYLKINANFIKIHDVGETNTPLGVAVEVSKTVESI